MDHRDLTIGEIIDFLKKVDSEPRLATGPTDDAWCKIYCTGKSEIVFDLTGYDPLVLVSYTIKDLNDLINGCYDKQK